MATKTYQRAINFTRPQIAWLRQRARTLGVSVAELVRRAVDTYRERKEHGDK